MLKETGNISLQRKKVGLSKRWGWRKKEVLFRQRRKLVEKHRGIKNIVCPLKYTML